MQHDIVPKPPCRTWKEKQLQAKDEANKKSGVKLRFVWIYVEVI